MGQTRALNNREIARAAVIVLLGFLASGVLGLVRTAVIAGTFGTGAALDAFFAAQQIPELIFVLVAGGALGSSFIPVYARLREHDDDRAAWRLASATMTLSALAAAMLGIILALTAPLYIPLLMPESNPEVQELAMNLTRLMMVTPVIFAISGLVMGLLQAHQLFLLPSAAISMNNIGLMIGALAIARVLPPDTGIAQVGGANVYGMAYGAILSALLHLFVQLPGLKQIKAKLRFLPNWRVKGVMEVLRLMGPRVLGLAVVRVNFLVNIFFTSAMIEGSYTALYTAFTLMFFVLGVIGQSIGSAVFPSLAALHAEGDMDGFKDRLANAMRSIIFLSLPATVGLIVLAEPVVSIFERGAWTSESTTATAWALMFYATGIVGFALLEVLSRAFYALEDTWTPVKIGTLAMISNIVLSAALIRLVGDPDSLAHGPFAGLALANAATTLIEALVLWWLLRKRVGQTGQTAGIHDSYILYGALRTFFASFVMGVVVLGVVHLFRESAQLIQALAGAGVGVAVFFGIAFILGLEEAKAVPRMVLRKLRR